MSTAPQVIAAFASTTGIAIRVISHNMESQAIDFLAKGFTIAELVEVLRWTQSQITLGKNGMSKLSLQWHVIMGKYGSGGEFETFQTRLAMAQQTIRTRPAPREVPHTTDVGNGKITVFAPAPEPPAEDIGQEVAKQLAEYRRSLSA